MKDKTHIQNFKTISGLTHYLGQPDPLQRLIALIDYSKMVVDKFEKGTKIILDFYKISFKNKFSGQVKYDQGYYNFGDCGLAFGKPNQQLFRLTKHLVMKVMHCISIRIL